MDAYATSPGPSTRTAARRGRRGDRPAPSPLGTRDALLHYRAGVIYQAAGDPARARRHLAESLAINPGFSPVDAEDARERLHDLGDGS